MKKNVAELTPEEKDVWRKIRGKRRKKKINKVAALQKVGFAEGWFEATRYVGLDDVSAFGLLKKAQEQPSTHIQRGYLDGIQKLANDYGLTQQQMINMIKLANYGDLNAAEMLGQGVKYGLRGPAALVGAPLLYPLSALQSGGGVAGANLVGDELNTNVIGGQGAALPFHASTAAMLRRMNEISKADPELGEQFKQYLQGLDSDATGTSGAAAGLLGGYRGLQSIASLGASIPANVLNSAMLGSGGQARFREGLEGDKAGRWRQLFDPVGYGLKNVGYEMGERNPELQAKILEALTQGDTE